MMPEVRPPTTADVAAVVGVPTWRKRRHGILPERTISGVWFGSYGPERSDVTCRPLRTKRKPETQQTQSRARRHLP